MTDNKRPIDLPDNAVEPRCGDIVQFSQIPSENYMSDGGLFKVSTTSRYKHGRAENNYGFSEIDGDRAVNLSESEYVSQFDTDKSALWPVVFPKTDMGLSRRRLSDGRISEYRPDR